MLDTEITLLVTGDFCPQNRLEAALASSTSDTILGDLLPYIEKSCLSITNLECPLTEAKQPIVKTGPTLKAALSTAAFLKQAGFNLLTLANNHIMDYGPQGLNDTLDILAEYRISTLGAGQNKENAAQYFFLEKNGLSIAILNFTENEWSTTYSLKPGANPIHPIGNFQQIRQAKCRADRVVVITHGGHEMYNLPSPRMKELFRFYVEAGADAVINHHPHCISGFEIYRGAPIFYSLGNFLFDNPKHRNSIWNEGLAVSLCFTKEESTFDIIFFDQCNENATLEVCSEAKSADQMQKLRQLNEIISSDERLLKAFEEWALKHAKLYHGYIEPHRNRYLQALQNRGLLPSFWHIRKKRYLLNLLRCEAHHDVLKSILESETSNP